METPQGDITFVPDSLPDRVPDLRLVHYNDVYHVDASSAEPVGGIARFMTLINYYRNDARFHGQPELLTLFSGDAFNPSLESSVTKGAHMVPILNSIGTNVACVGNHDLDFGVKQFRNLTSQCKFPWLLANVLDPALGKDVPIGNAFRTTTLKQPHGINLGFIGLAEREWLETINVLPPNLEYRSASETAKQLSPKLKSDGANIVIALTHQREPNDNKLAEIVGNDVVDIILGGHDHYYSHSLINNVHVLRSGTDFKQLSYIEGWKRDAPAKGWDFRITRRDIVASIKEDEAMLKEVEKLTHVLKARLAKPIGYTLAPLDARFTTVRTKESNMGNFVCDLMRYYYHSDACIMASGTIRGDQIYPPGILKLKDLMNCFPFEDPVVVVRVTGQAILSALENSVCLYPALEGRFPQVSNITFSFDPSKPANRRIDGASVTLAGAPLDLQRKYKLCTRGYMARGKDGYTSLLVESEGGEAEELVNEENGVLISTILRQYFMGLRAIGKWKMWGASMGRHWDAVTNQLGDSSCPVIEPKGQDAVGSGAAETARRAVSISKVLNTNDRLSPSSTDESEGYDTDTESTESTSGQHGAANVAGGLLDSQERELVLMRRVVQKWRRLAGMKGEPAACDSLDEGEFRVKWTKAIAPRLEGRIRMLGEPVN